METKRNFDRAVQHAKACIGRDDLVFSKEQTSRSVEGALSGQRLLCVATDRIWQDQEPFLPASPVLFDYKCGRINPPEADLSVVIVVSPLVSLMVDQVSRSPESSISAAILSGNLGVDKKYLANERDVKTSRYPFYSCPEAIVAGEKWKQLLLEPPLSDTVVAVAVDKAHSVFKLAVRKCIIF